MPDPPVSIKPLPYRPSNGSEGLAFMERFCFRCLHDDAFQRGIGDSCPIAAASMAFKIGDPGYPQEWVEDEEGARCTAFLAVGDDPELAAARADPRQKAMFPDG